MLASFPEPRPTTNPYIVLLRDTLSASPELTLRLFSWRAALLGHYDVFHLHWPEILVTGKTTVGMAGRQLLTVMLLLRLRLTRRPLVRTLHNVEVREGINSTGRLIFALIRRWTSLEISLNESMPPPEGVPSQIILHGHYRQWYASCPKPAARPGQLSYFGLIRPYKGVERLLQAFGELDGSYRLHVTGLPNPDLVAPLTALAAMDDRVQLTLGYVGDCELVQVACRAEVVVLPYRQMHNSGGALAALSLDRPVLVPQNEVNNRLAEEVGPGWVHTYSGELTAQHLRETLDRVRASERSARPDLSRREWRLAAPQHVAAYRRAQQLLRTGRSWR